MLSVLALSHRYRIACLAIALASTPSCSEREAPALAPPRAPAETSASVATPQAPPPDPVAPTCADPTTRLVFDGPTAREEACGDAALCWGGECVPIARGPVVAGARVPRAALRALADEGWLNAWSGHGGLSTKTVEAFRADSDRAPLGRASAVCASDGWVVAKDPGGGRPSRAGAVLEATVFSREARDVELRAAAAGSMTVVVGDRRFEVTEMPGRVGRALPDERFFDLRLAPGSNDITVIVDGEGDGFYLRIRERDGRPARGLLYAERDAGAACTAAALLDTNATWSVVGGGFGLTMLPAFRGAVPPLAASTPLAVQPRSKSHDPVKQLDIPRLDLVTRPVPRTVTFPPTRGLSGVEATLDGDRAFSASLPDYGPLPERAGALVALAARVAGDERLPEGSRASFEHHVGVITRAIARGEPDRAWLDRLTGSAEALGKKLEAGNDAYADARGIVLRAYRSPLDGALQGYVVYVPKSYDKKRSSPVVIVAHGKDRLPEHALRTLVGEARDETMTLAFAAHNPPTITDQGAIYAAPWGRGNAGPRPVGEHDMLSVIAELRRAYRIDERRIGLTGYSLGGTVSFVLPLHYPDVFSSAAPLCGYPNLMGYESVARVSHLPWEAALLAKEYIVRYADNGQYVPLNIVHGGKDGPSRSQVVADRYKALGYPHTFDVQPHLDHNVWDYAYEDAKMVPWLTKHAVPTLPKRVRFVTGKLRYHRSHWVEVLEMIDGSRVEPAAIDATFDDRAGRVRVETSNVGAFALALDRLGAPRVVIEVDGVELEAEATGRVVLRRGADGRFAIGDGKPSAKKRPGLSGPLDDIEHEPVTIVYGSRDPAMAEANRLVAEHLSSLGGTADIAYPVLDDDVAQESDLEGRSVILVGSPSQNRLTDAIADSLPVRFEGAAIAVRGTRYEGKHLAASFISPGPEAFFGQGALRTGSRYVVVHAGTSPRAVLAARFLPRYLPDYVVYDAGLAVKRGGLLMDGRPVRAAGFFDESWR